MQVLHSDVSEVFLVSFQKSSRYWVYPEYCLSRTVVVPTKPDNEVSVYNL